MGVIYKLNRLSNSIVFHGVVQISIDNNSMKFYLLRKDLAILLNLPKSPVEADGFSILTYGASSPTSAISTATLTRRSAAYSSNSVQKSFLLFCTSANVVQQESITICIQPITQLLVTAELLSSDHLKK